MGGMNEPAAIARQASSCVLVLSVPAVGGQPRLFASGR